LFDAAQGHPGRARGVFRIQAAAFVLVLEERQMGRELARELSFGIA
jgi:hypothetical protein